MNGINQKVVAVLVRDSLVHVHQSITRTISAAAVWQRRVTPAELARALRRLPCNEQRGLQEL
jgi:hypothetical protein